MLYKKSDIILFLQRQIRIFVNGTCRLHHQIRFGWDNRNYWILRRFNRLIIQLVTEFSASLSLFTHFTSMLHGLTTLNSFFCCVYQPDLDDVVIIIITSISLFAKTLRNDQNISCIKCVNWPRLKLEWWTSIYCIFNISLFHDDRICFATTFCLLVRSYAEEHDDDDVANVVLSMWNQQANNGCDIHFIIFPFFVER